MEITKETVREIKNGWQTAGLERVQITPLELYALKGILMTCPGSQYEGGGNDAMIWIGGPKVTADQNVNSGGMPIAPGSSIFIPCEKPNELWVVSDQADQKIAWMLL